MGHGCITGAERQQVVLRFRACSNKKGRTFEGHLSKPGPTLAKNWLQLPLALHALHHAISDVAATPDAHVPDATHWKRIPDLNVWGQRILQTDLGPWKMLEHIAEKGEAVHGRCKKWTGRLTFVLELQLRQTAWRTTTNDSLNCLGAGAG
jgi:hypothetical protein